LKTRFWGAALCALLDVQSAAPAFASALRYPAAPHDATTDTYFGTTVADPYRPLEQMDAPATKTWLDQEIALTQTYFAAIPQRAAIAAHLRRMANYERVGLPYHIGKRYFYTYNSGLQNQSVLYTMTGLHGKARVLIDPNTLSADGTVALGPTAVTRDAKYIAYATQSAGSDWETWHVRDIASGKDLADTVSWSKFSDASWKADDSGFFYARYDEPKAGETYKNALYYQKVFFHKIGTPQSADTLVYQDSNHKNYFFSVDVTEDGRYAVLTQSGGGSENTRLYYEDLHSAHPQFAPIEDKGDAQWSYVDNRGPVFYLQTDKDAPNFKVLAVDTRAPQSLRTVIPQGTSAMQSVNSAGGYLFAEYLKDAHSQVKQYALDGRLVRVVALPGVGTASGFSGLRGDKDTFFSFAAYTSPPVIFHYRCARARARFTARRRWPSTRGRSSRTKSFTRAKTVRASP